MPVEETTTVTEHDNDHVTFDPVKLTGTDGRPMVVDANAITHVGPHHSGKNTTGLGTIGGLVVEVTETIEDVLKALGWA